MVRFSERCSASRSIKIEGVGLLHNTGDRRGVTSRLTFMKFVWR